MVRYIDLVLDEIDLDVFRGGISCPVGRNSSEPFFVNCGTERSIQVVRKSRPFSIGDGFRGATQHTRHFILIIRAFVLVDDI